MTPPSSSVASARTTATPGPNWEATREGELLPLPLSPRMRRPTLVERRAPLSFSGTARTGVRHASCVPDPRSCRGSERADVADRDVLDVEVLVDALGAALAAVARLLDAAEGGGGRRDDAVVGADDAVLEA